ncbi:hypothetical protein, partial [Archangium gephyra]
MTAKHEWWKARLQLNKARMDLMQNKANHLRSQGASTTAAEDDSINRQYEPSWLGKLADARNRILQCQRD